MRTFIITAIALSLANCALIDFKINKEVKQLEKTKPAWIGSSPLWVPPIVNPPSMTTL